MFFLANIFQPLIDVFQHVIVFFHDHLGLSWGLSIVFLTICVRIVLLPLTIRQFSSMRKLQHLQPQMKAIQQKYKDDKQRQQEEMMKFYREEGVNPLGSCLPLVAQLPVFISLFYMLRKNLREDICPITQQTYREHYAHNYLLHNPAATHAAAHAAAAGQTIQCGPVPGAGFLFIHDITDTASGVTLIVLLALYVGTQIASTLLMSSPTMDKTQRNMMLFLPLIFVLFIIRFPAGLIVYWITTNTWTMVQQYTLKRMMGPPPAAPATAVATSNGGSRGGGGGATSRGKASPAGGPDDGGSDSGSGSGGLGGMLRGAGTRAKAKDESSGSDGATARPAARPPQPPRKKKKRSGRRR